jgi:N6-L-threonylcarbamoyladenine synthase
MIVLGIETSCDETAASLVRNGKEILSHEIASSADLHEQYGGVFPELACRRHSDLILPVIQKALVKPIFEIDLIAVSRGPGLIGALLIGMQTAKGLALAWNKPWIGINHVEAHLYAAMMGEEEPPFPALGIVLSGGHTFMAKIFDVGSYELIGTTVDDAIGEAFDKVGTLLGLPYPGGPKVEILARQGNPYRFPLKAGYVKKNPLYFSFSGLKTSVLYTLKGEEFSEQDKADMAASFQETALYDIAHKARLALASFPAKAILLGGGVSNNQRLRAIFSKEFPELPIFWPPKGLSLDNAAMIAGLGFKKFLQNPVGDPWDLEVEARIPIA